MANDDTDFLSEIQEAVDNGGEVSEPVNTPAQTIDPNTQQIDPSLSPVQSPDDIVNNLVGDTDDQEKETKTQETTSTTEITDENKQKTKEKLSVKTPQEIEEAQAAAAKKAKEEGKPGPVKGSKLSIDQYLQEDDKGNFVDDAGEVLIMAGKGRALLEDARKEAYGFREKAAKLALSNNQVGEAMKKLFNQHNALKESKGAGIETVAQTNNLSVQEATDALSFMQKFKADPLNALKQMLTTAHTNGIDVSSLGSNIQADPNTMKQMIEGIVKEQIAPLSTQATKSTEQQQIVDEANAFMEKYPTAEPHLEVIAKAKRANPDSSLETIWLQYQLFMAQNPEKFQTTSTAETATEEPKTTKEQEQQTNQPQQVNQKPRKGFTTSVKVPDKKYETMGYQEMAHAIMKEGS